jgi:MFS family permease
MLGISWMWFFGAVFLSQFPSFAKEVLHGNEQVASLLLVVFSIGIATGSLLCEVLSKRHVEIGLVPVGAIGMSVFAWICISHRAACLPVPIMSVGAFMSQHAHWRVMIDLALLSLFAGLYSVPMYALIQLRSQPTHRARIIAANNILNALFMIVSAFWPARCSRPTSASRRFSCSWAWPTRWWRSTSSCWCPSTCCVSSR